MADATSSHAIGASRSIYYSLTDEVPGLTDEEKSKLEAVMLKAMEFEAEEKKLFKQPLEGQLYKYTNVVKGWQYRWFVVSPETSMIEYYMGAIVSISEEDSHSFMVSDAYGEVFKLKAADAKERLIWVDKIKSVIARRASDSFEIAKKDTQTTVQSSFALCKSSSNDSEMSNAVNAKTPIVSTEKPSNTETDSTNEIRESVFQALKCQKVLAKSIEILPSSGSDLKCSDTKLLLLKAISQATVQSLEQCFTILKRHRDREFLKSTALSIASSGDTLEKSKISVLRKD